MFTGIITDIGIVKEVIEHSQDKSLWITTNYDLQKIGMGASICCNGCCLTLVEKEKDSFKVDISAETLSKTNLGSLKINDRINLEKSLAIGDEIGGHIVTGHIDGLAKILKIESEGKSKKLTLLAPSNLKYLIAAKGSISLNGISLTVNQVNNAQFAVNIIPHTWQQTNINNSSEGDLINLEIDILARYIARQLEKVAV